jgi:LysR family nitrogen assimilation transcriptional regulator
MTSEAHAVRDDVAVGAQPCGARELLGQVVGAVRDFAYGSGTLRISAR